MSGQIGSTSEWYLWIGLEKDINRYRFLIFKFPSWIFQKTSKFWAASCKNESNFLLVWILSSYWLAHFYLMKKSAKVLLYFGLDCRMLEFFTHRDVIQRTIDVSPAFLEHGYAEKIAVWAHANRIQTSRRLDSFLHEADQNFDLLSNIKDQK